MLTSFKGQVSNVSVLQFPYLYTGDNGDRNYLPNCVTFKWLHTYKALRVVSLTWHMLNK